MEVVLTGLCLVMTTVGVLLSMVNAIDFRLLGVVRSDKIDFRGCATTGVLLSMVNAIERRDWTARNRSQQLNI